MKKRNVFKRIETKRHLIPVLLVIAVLLSGMCVLPGCSLKGINNTKKEEIDYTVVEDEDLPAELKKLIDEKKNLHTGIIAYIEGLDKQRDIYNKRLYIYGCRLWNYDNEWLQYKR